MRVPLTVRLLIGLVAGLILGNIVSASNVPALRAIPDYVEPIGTLWANAIRMTVIPLIVSLLVTSIAADRVGSSVHTIAGRITALMIALIAVTATFAAIAGPLLLSVLQIDPAATAAARAAAGTSSVALPSFRNWLIDLVPANLIKAAADGALLPLIVATAALALALGRVTGEARDTTLRLFEAIRDAMFVLIGWILAAGPVGVFALVLTLTARLGQSAAGALGYFVLIACVMVTASLIALYPIVGAFSRVRMMEFARAVAPAQVVAFTTRSSLAALPALAAAAVRLNLPQSSSGLALPVGVSIFKYSSPIVRITGTLLVARLYGVQLEPPQIAAIAAAIGILSFYSPGIPSGGLFVMAPLYASFGLPIEGVGILIALDVIPDMFITAANVTADLAVATIVSPRQHAVDGWPAVPLDR
jgi:proton glutamate symport protein